MIAIRTASGASLAASRAMRPPRLQPTSVTGVPVGRVQRGDLGRDRRQVGPGRPHVAAAVPAVRAVAEGLAGSGGARRSTGRSRRGPGRTMTACGAPRGADASNGAAASNPADWRAPAPRAPAGASQVPRHRPSSSATALRLRPVAPGRRARPVFPAGASRAGLCVAFDRLGGFASTTALFAAFGAPLRFAAGFRSGASRGFVRSCRSSLRRRTSVACASASIWRESALVVSRAAGRRAAASPRRARSASAARRLRRKRRGDLLTISGCGDFRVRPLQRGELLDDEVGDPLRVRHGLAAGDQAEIQRVEIALHGDVERAAVEGIESGK